jgi:amino acid transporter
MSHRLGPAECVSIALGGMIGGGIFAVLGVVAGITGPATWLAFVLAGVVALCAGHSYLALNRLADERGGSVTFVQHFTGNTTAAGMLGWTLLFGYIGSMAMYAFAFGRFALRFGLPEVYAGVPLRPVLSVGVIAAFVGLNRLGSRATGAIENLLVGGKVGILLALGLGGVVYATAIDPRPLSFGDGGLLTTGPVVAAAISFVAFQGWQLLFYDQPSIENPVETIRTAVYVAIPAAVAIYVLVAVTTTNLASEALRTHPHTALASAAEPLLGTFGYASVGVTIVAVAALFSTGSAINATLFSSAHFATGMVSSDLLPDRIAEDGVEGASPRSLLFLGGVTATLTALGSLDAITSFASLSFIVVFGAMSLIAFTHRDRDPVVGIVSLGGVVGTAAFFPLMFGHLYRNEPSTFAAVVTLAVGALAVELLYFERERLQAEIEAFEADLEAALTDD